jgi:phosphatidylserine/phosphatidylglycerophosphate/cardiolipin synthase-like enzyme
VRRNPLHGRLAALPSGSVLRIAASHVRDFDVARCLVGLVGRGVRVDLLTGGSGRRAPSRIGKYLIAGGVRVFRFAHPRKLPMHAKFMLAEGPLDRWVAFGSYNLTRTSRWLNQEMLAFSSDLDLWWSLDARWAEMTSDRWVEVSTRQIKPASIFG